MRDVRRRLSLSPSERLESAVRLAHTMQATRRAALARTDGFSGWENWPFDPLPVLSALARHQADYILIGGLAAVLQGFPLPTYDIDIVPAPGPASHVRIAAALADLDGTWPARRPHSRVVTRCGYVDVHVRPAGFNSYREARRESHQYLLEPGIRIAVLSLRGILRSRIACGDLRQLPALEATLELAEEAP